MLESRATHYLTTIQLRLPNPSGADGADPGRCDQDLYYVITKASAIKRLRSVAARLRKGVARGESRTVGDVVKYLGDELGGHPGTAAYRAIAIRGGFDTVTGDEDVWLDTSDHVERCLLLEYTRFWPVPALEADCELLELEQGVRDRPLLALEWAIERRGCRAYMVWRSDKRYIGLGARSPAGEPRALVDRPLDARSEPAAIREMGLTPLEADSRWHRRALRSLGEIAGIA
jgi:hypothetical protein